MLAVGAAVVAADQATKAIALATLTEGRTTPVIDGVLHWTLHRNPGAAFGSFQGVPWLFTILAAAVTVGILVFMRRVSSIGPAISLGLILGGAAGNLVDRIVRPPGVFRGHVIDFIDFRVWPTFNLADAAIVSGAVLMVLLEMRSAKGDTGAEDGREERRAGP